MVDLRRWASAATGVVLVAIAGFGGVVTQPTSPGSFWPGSGCGGAVPPVKPDGGAFECAFSDDFSDPLLDTDKWLVQETSYSGMTAPPDACYVESPDNVSIGDGNLRLTALRGLAPFVCSTPSTTYLATATVATVATRERFTQTYGRFEFRAKMPDLLAPGGHAALWLYPAEHVYGPWPNSGEVDVAEWFSARPANVYPSVHYAGENVLLSTGYDCTVAGADTAFHVYAVEWTPTTMRFFYDGALCFEHDWMPAAPLAAPQPFDRPFYVVLTEVWGHLWNEPTADTPNTATLLVDWVRVWR